MVWAPARAEPVLGPRRARTRGLGRGDSFEERRTALRLPVLCPRILRRLRSLIQPVIPHHAGDAQAIIAEDAAAALGLRGAVLGDIAPARDRVLVAPEGEGEDLALVAQALEPLDRDEAVDLLELGLQRGGQVEIVAAVIGVGPDFENDGDHAAPPNRGIRLLMDLRYSTGPASAEISSPCAISALMPAAAMAVAIAWPAQACRPAPKVKLLRSARSGSKTCERSRCGSRLAAASTTRI